MSEAMADGFDREGKDPSGETIVGVARAILAVTAIIAAFALVSGWFDVSLSTDHFISSLSGR
ncbi:MAG: hypothetical protein KDK07_03415 [Bauldia sp.]|nr:hypothetical protein [Bauldia sp.]